MTQTGTPVVPVSSLELFVSYSRASYQAQFGADAPAFDATRPLQRWFDPAQKAAAPSTVVSYNYFDQSAGSLSTFTITAGNAASPNISDTWTLGGVPGEDNQPVYWDAGTPAKAAPNPPIPAPVRALNPGESIEQVPSGFPGVKMWAVVTEGATPTAPAPATADGFTAADRAVLATVAQQIGDVHAAVGQILAGTGN